MIYEQVIKKVPKTLGLESEPRPNTCGWEHLTCSRIVDTTELIFTSFIRHITRYTFLHVKFSFTNLQILSLNRGNTSPVFYYIFQIQNIKLHNKTEIL